jgi:acyl-coenzyme A synthetase/AMP-(fatty) acid ligase
MIDWNGITKAYGSRILFQADGESVTYAGFVNQVQSITASIQPDPNNAVSMDIEWTAHCFANFLAHLSAGQSVSLGDMETPGALMEFPQGQPFLILPTGGTTGTPKHVVHSVETLLSPYRLESRDPIRILTLYAADHIAGLDAFFQALHKGSTLVTPRARDAASIGDCIEKFKIDVLPATPTFLQFLILGGIASANDLSSVKAIPHGAEPMPGALRERIRSAFPNARLIHRFGMTELGALPVREDPDHPEALFLDAPGYAWKLIDGEIHIKGLTPFLGTLEGGPIDPDNYWHATGDLGELSESGSMRILGRREAMINVGGEKVFPERVESFLLEHSDVRDVCVMGAPSPLTGQTVVAEVVFSGDLTPMQLMRDMRKAAREKGISLAHVPTRITPVEVIQYTRIGKRSRTQGNA